MLDEECNIKSQFNFDLERMKYYLNTEFVKIPDTVESLEDFKQWLEGGEICDS